MCGVKGWQTLLLRDTLVTSRRACSRPCTSHTHIDRAALHLSIFCSPPPPHCAVQVLCALQLLVNVLGEQSQQVYPLLGLLLRHALNPSSSREPELLEDGLALWLVALRNAPGDLGGAGGAGELLSLYPLLVDEMANSTGSGVDVWRVCSREGQGCALCERERERAA